MWGNHNQKIACKGFQWLLKQLSAGTFLQPPLMSMREGPSACSKVRQRTQATNGTMRTSTSTPCRKDTVLGQFLDQPCRSHTCENWNGHTIASTLFAKFGLNSFDTCIRHIGALLAWLPRSGWTFHVATCFSSLWGRPLASGSVLHRLLWHG